MPGNPFQAPGDDFLKEMTGLKPARPDSLLVRGKGRALGGGARKAPEGPKPAEPEAEPLDMTGGAAAPEEKPKDEKKAVLSDAAWVKEETRFLEDAEVSVKLTLPEDKKGLTRVRVELHALPSQGQPIAKGEGFAGQDGKAVLTLPIYQPDGYQEGPVDYYLVFKHAHAKDLSTESAPRKVSETALKAADHAVVSGASFPKNSSFLGPRDVEGFKKLERRFKAWEMQYPGKTRIVVYGHAEKDEEDAKALSERRAQSVHAFITGDADAWEKLYAKEAWGLLALQILLKDLGHYAGTPNGSDGSKTQAAFKAFQKKAGLPQTGAEDAATRKALFTAYMQGKRDIQLEASRFRQVAGHPWMGCAVNNRMKDGEAAAPQNRRTVFILLRESKNFPIYFPCKDGDEKPCGFQRKKPGPRSTPGIKCRFYDELVREKTQEFCEEEPQGEPEGISYEEARKIAFEVTAYYETSGAGYDTLAGNFDGAGISFGALQWNIGRGTLQELLTQFESEDKAAFEKCFEDDKEALEKIRAVMAEEGVYNTKTKRLDLTEGMKWATEEVQTGDVDRPTWLGKWKTYFQNLGQHEKFQAVQRRDGLARNTAPTEAKIKWLKEKNPSAWAKVPLRCYCALFDLSNQYMRTGKELSEVEKSWATGIPPTAFEMTEDFCKVVVDSRKLEKDEHREVAHRRRQGILYAGHCDSVPGGYPEPDRRKKVENLLQNERFIVDYPG